MSGLRVQEKGNHNSDLSSFFNTFLEGLPCLDMLSLSLLCLHGKNFAERSKILAGYKSEK